MRLFVAADQAFLKLQGVYGLFVQSLCVELYQLSVSPFDRRGRR
jgi:hypothetical protein